ncbi:MAG TPA: hypothetical protein VGP82_21295 [Ktedonobacterales bacterium]|nr:hypothetical protein [Ktedonobacterales bacterium]
MDPDTLGERVLAVVQETMQPTHASLWLRPSSGREPGGGIGHSRAQSGHGAH